MYMQVYSTCTGLYISTILSNVIGVMLSLFLSVLFRKCLAVVFIPIIERELREFVRYWNSHRIRNSRRGNCIGGIPDDLFQMPLHYGNGILLLYT